MSGVQDSSRTCNSSHDEECIEEQTRKFGQMGHVEDTQWVLFKFDARAIPITGGMWSLDSVRLRSLGLLRRPRFVRWPPRHLQGVPDGSLHSAQLLLLWR